MEPEGSLLCSQEPTQCVPRTYVTFRNKLFFLRWGIFNPPLNPQDGGPTEYYKWLIYALILILSIDVYSGVSVAEYTETVAVFVCDRSSCEPLVHDEQSVPYVGDLPLLRVLLQSAGSEANGEQEAFKPS